MGGRDGAVPPRADAPRRHPAATFAVAFADALEAQRRSLTWLRNHLEQEGVKVALSTLSYWRSGQRQPEGAASREAVLAIEVALGLAAGTLDGTLYPARRSGPATQDLPAEEVFRTEGDVAAVLTDLDLSDWTSFLSEKSIHATVDVDEHGNDHRVTVRTMMVALRDGAQRFPLALAGPPPMTDPPRFRAVAGCRFGRTVTALDQGIVAAEMLTDRPLAAGESVVVEHETLLPSTPHTYYEHHVQRTVRDLMVWVRFHPARLPVEACVYLETGDRRHERTVDVRGSRGVHHAVAGFGPGVVGVAWRWDR